MSTVWRRAADGAVSDEHLVECLGWMGWLTPEQLARLCGMGPPGVRSALERLRRRGLVAENESGLWQPTAAGRFRLAELTGLDWGRQQPLTDAAQHPCTAAVIEIIRLARAAGLGAVAAQLLASEAVREADGRLPALLGLSLVLDESAAGRSDVPWVYGPALGHARQQLVRFAVEVLDRDLRTSSWLQERGRQYGKGLSEHWLPLWVAPDEAHRLDLLLRLLAEDDEGSSAVTDPAWLVRDRVVVCEAGWSRETCIFGQENGRHDHE